MCDCPLCGDGDGYLNIGRVHFGICEPCGIRWVIGENLFSSWRDEDEATWERNGLTLERFTKYNPLPLSTAERAAHERKYRPVPSLVNEPF